ncbi:adenosylmethionine decarboxylase [Sphaerisporangium album]|uniref:S-adenosylmethionine decarboxylase proenzyme n=1 Tax=Sphaerisporangium album TaxID=509200 RepID=A0A367ESR0_9ACTN|nr:adenosylmethionine decarboxylase [Sphaerisporangium album]RCG21156.1 adenosylmethionine decarboxylase [Sphaerisporangium album]
MSALAPIGEFHGRHVVAQLAGVEGALLDDVVYLEQALHMAAVEAGAKVRQVVSERFEPHGVTVVAILSESHATLHTYPEIGACYVDIFTCGDSADPENAVRVLLTALRPQTHESTTIERGMPSSADDQPQGAAR